MICACADISNYKHRDVKLLLLKLWLDFQNVIKKFHVALRCKQYADWISNKGNASTKRNA